jgi:hypothetical protein
MISSKLSWLILGVMGLFVVVIVGLVAAFVGLDYLRLGETSITISTPTAEVVPPSTEVSASGRIGGLVWHDLCVSGVEGQPGPASAPEGCVSTSDGGYKANGVREANEPGLAGVRVRLGLGACPAVGLAETMTAADGSFAFSALSAGSYCVSIDPALSANAGILLPGDWSSPVGSPQASLSVTLSEGEARGGVEFGWDYQFLPLPPTATATATNTPTPTLTPTPTATSTPTIPCDWVAFVSDVTVPDGTIFKPDQDFRKTWRLKNIGSCTWTMDYDLVYVSGNRMTGDKVTALKTAIKPGQTVDISIELTAPIEIGTHTGYWALRNASGVVFGMGAQAKDPFWVIVNVEKPKKIVYDLAEHYCEAVWISGAGSIECPTESYDVSGSIVRLDPPVMEGGRVENEAGLWVIPEGVTGGTLTGTFPAIEIKAGDRFRTTVSCLNEYTACDVEFRLEYQIGDGEIKSLGKWRETYDGKYTTVDIDLTPLAGKEVKFILKIRAGDVFDQDSGLWLHPSVRGEGDVRLGHQQS